MSIPEQIKPHLKRPIAVLGYGVSGRGLASLLQASGIWFEVYDERDGEAEFHEFTENEAKQHSLVVYSPGFPPEHPWLLTAQKANCSLLGELDFASLFWSGALIAVTGTNGKTTVAEFLSFALKRSGIPAVAAGNIGYPLSRLFELENAAANTAVCEISSFQSESIRYFNPQALLWTNFAEDHLDRYSSMRDYFAAKLRLVESLASPRLFIGTSVAHYAEEFGFELPAFAQVVSIDESETVPGSCFSSYPQRENYQIVKAYWREQGLSPRILTESAKLFKTPRHRLAEISKIGSVSFWNDSKATNFASTIAALRSFESPVLWIGGGKAKGGDIVAFSQEISPHIRKAFLIGETSAELASLLEVQGMQYECFETIDLAVAAAYAFAEGAGNVVLSPGFSSFDQFSGYAERGIRFEKAVLSLKNAAEAHTSVECAVISEKSL